MNADKWPEWTADRVRRELPDVPVIVGDETATGQVSGRCLDFARVDYRVEHRGTARIVASWTTLARVLNNDSALQSGQ